MKKKIIGIFVCTLFICSAIAGAVSKNVTSVNEDKISIDDEDKIFGSTIMQQNRNVCNVWLKFFVHDEFNKNLTNMTRNINRMFFNATSQNNILFGHNGSSNTLSDDDFANTGSSSGRRRLLRKLKTDYDNCSNGINVVIGPSTFAKKGVTSFKVCNGTRGLSYGGVMIRDTCNETQMTNTLAHELLHALGLSHEQVKWRNQSAGGEIESKPLQTTLIDYHGPGKDKILRAHRLGFSCPPHSYAYFDNDSDCDCDRDLLEQPRNSNGRKIWDINGNCTFGDTEDRNHLLWGRGDRTGTNVSTEQREYMYDNANSTPGYRVTQIGQTVGTPQLQNTNSNASEDEEGDVSPGFLDILGSLGIFYWEYGYLYLSLDLFEEIPDGSIVLYWFFLDIDNDPDTGCPLGYEYRVELGLYPEYTGAGLYEWIESDQYWFKIKDLPWHISFGTEHWVEDDADEDEVNGTLVEIEVEIVDLNLVFQGKLRVTPVALDGEASRIYDQCPDMYLSKEQAVLPVLNLNPFEGEPGSSVVANGYDFTSNTDVIIEFDGVEVAMALADVNGDFTVSFDVPRRTSYHWNGQWSSRNTLRLRLYCNRSRW